MEKLTGRLTGTMHLRVQHLRTSETVMLKPFAIYLGFLKSFYRIDLTFNQKHLKITYNKKCITALNENLSIKQAWHMPRRRNESIYLIHFWENYAWRGGRKKEVL